MGKNDTMVPLVTQHCASLQPWISSSDSNLLNWLKTVVSKSPETLAMIIKRKKLETQVQTAFQDELENF